MLALETGGETVEIIGVGFAPGVQVKFGTESATVVKVHVDRITVITPLQAAAAVDIVVTNPDQRQATLPSGFTYEP